MKGTLKSIHFESDSKGADACKPDYNKNTGISLGMFHRIGWQFKRPRKDTIYLKNYLTGLC